MSTSSCSHVVQRNVINPNAQLIPGLPNDIWRLIVLYLYHSLPEKYREQAVHVLHSVSRGWRVATEEMSVLWTLVTYGQARRYPKEGVKPQLLTMPITLPDYQGANGAARGNGETRREDVSVDGGMEDNVGQVPRDVAQLKTENPAWFPPCTWSDFNPRQKRAVCRFARSLARSGEQSIQVQITLHQGKSVRLDYLSGLFMNHAERISSLNIEAPRGEERTAQRPEWVWSELAYMLSDSVHKKYPPKTYMYTRLEHLCLCNIFFHMASEPVLLLQSCPALVTLEIHSARGYQNLWQPEPLSLLQEDNIFVPALEEFITEMAFLLILWNHGLLTPKLSRLMLSNVSSIDLDHVLPRAENAYSWVSALRALGLVGTFSDTVIERLICHMPFLDSLGLKHCGGPQLFRDVLTQTVLDDVLGLTTIVPRLTKVRIQDGAVDDEAILAVLENRLSKPDGCPKPLVFTLLGCKRTTAILGEKLIRAGRGIWMP